jgi:hypothetical protein
MKKTNIVNRFLIPLYLLFEKHYSSMSKKTLAGNYKVIATVVVALTFGITAAMLPVITSSLIPSAYAWKWNAVHFNLNLHQLLAQINQCVTEHTQCVNSGGNLANISLNHEWFNKIILDQTLAQQNNCSDVSTCINSGSNNANIHLGQYHHSSGSFNFDKLDQSIAQENDCTNGSTCINLAGNTANIH